MDWQPIETAPKELLKSGWEAPKLKEKRWQFWRPTYHEKALVEAIAFTTEQRNIDR